MVIEGEVIFPKGTKPISGATLIATLQDTREADAPARIVRKHMLPSVSHDPARSRSLPFSLEYDAPASLGLTVSVLVDLDGDGRTSPGDFINMESYRVKSEVNRQKVRVRVFRVPFHEGKSK